MGDIMLRNVIITGANSGIGKAAAKRFAKEGYHVIMACRNLERSKLVQEQIINQTNNKNVDLLQLDISSFPSIREFCSKFKQTYDHLDILIHNAAYFNHGEKEYQTNSDNIEITFATNTFGPFLMTELLLDHLTKSKSPKILHACTTNIRHFFDPKRVLDTEVIRKNTNKSSVYKRYGDSKMALLMLTFKMAKEYKALNIKVNAVQIPAIKMSKETLQKVSPSWRLIARIQNLFIPEPDTMADTYFHICTSEETKDATGQYFNKRNEVMHVSHYPKGFKNEIQQLFNQKVYPRYATDPMIIDKIWKMCNGFQTP